MTSTLESAINLDDPESDLLLSERAYRFLEEAIVTLRLAPGTLLSETQVARDVGVGRTPVREALQRLRTEGLVLVLPKRGVLVTEINPRSQLRLLEVRRVLETLMSQQAAQRALPEERRRFKELASKFGTIVDAADELSFMRADREFNVLIAAASHNEYCERMMQSIHGLSRRFFFKYRTLANLAVTAANHASVAEAVAQGDLSAAAGAVERLINHNEDFTMQTLRH